METVIGAVVIAVGYLMAGLAALWLGWSLVLWGVELVQDGTSGIARLVGAFLLIALFPMSLLAIPLIVRHWRAQEDV